MRRYSFNNRFNVFLRCLPIRVRAILEQKLKKKARLTQQTLWQWMRNRVEILVPILGLPLVFAMLDGGLDVRLAPVWTALIYGLALMYAIIVLWQPLALPGKTPQPISCEPRKLKKRVVRSVIMVVGGLVLTVAIQSLFHRTSSRQSSAGQEGYLIYFLLTIVIGSAGVVAEQTLPADLFPMLRHKDIRRILYVIASAVFVMMFLMFCHGMLIEPLAQSVSQAFGESPLPEKQGLTYFDGYINPIELFVGHLISAGFEELLFRVGVLTVVWAITRRLGWGVLVSSITFGFYHITLSGMSAYYMQAPIFAVLSTAGMGALNAILYRYRGFSTAVLVHAVGNWLFMALIIFS